MVSEQGRKANRSGGAAEAVIKSALKFYGYQYERQYVVGKTIYGLDFRVDFFIVNVTGYPLGLIVESKWQDRRGSIDEKFPYLVANLRLQSIPAVIVLAGNGYRPEARDWLLAQRDDHLVAVYSMEEFMSWLGRCAEAPCRDAI